MLLKQLRFFTLLLLLPSLTSAQEVLTGLQFNASKQSMDAGNELHLKNGVASKLTLPFFDDFSRSNIIPDQNLWADKDVFVNKDFPLFPPNIGAATFDVLDKTGRVYQRATAVPFVADYLTSRPIRLDSLFSPIARKLRPSDSVYLSFYYQPQGRGDAPEPWDSLVLQLGYPTGNLVFDRYDSITLLVDDILDANGLDFLLPGDTVYAPLGCDTNLFIINQQTLFHGDFITIPCDSVMVPEIAWRYAWSSPGMSLEDFVDSNGRYFKQVLVPIVDTVFFSDNFQFRFYNIGTIADQISPTKRSNVDQWSIDFVYLNYNRNRHDTTYRKLSFSGRPPSFLRRYESMPYRQYRADAFNAIRQEFEVLITNMDGIERNTKYRYSMVETGGGFEAYYDGGSANLPPFGVFGFQNCLTGAGAAHACPPVVSLFSLNFDRDTTSYLITHYISDSSGAVPLVDSMTYRQGFYNYFAYDDGTPELGYGLSGARSMLAYQFRMVAPDTLRGIQIFFNRTLNDANYQFFDIVVWRDNNGKPGDELYRMPRQRPVWTDQIYGFHQYDFLDPIIVNGLFYVGIQQESADNLNIGFDAVNNSRQYLFYNVDGTWRNSDYDGSLMIRPVLGQKMFVGLNEHNPPAKKSFSIYPNPTSGQLHIALPDTDMVLPQQIVLTDFKGSVLLQLPFSDQLNISHLPQGIYLLTIVFSDGSRMVDKVLKTR